MPKKRTGAYAAFCFLLLAASFGAAIAGHELGYRAFYAVSFVLVLFAAQVFTVYAASSYEYRAEEGIFRIYRKTGKKRVCVFDLDLKYADAVVPYGEFKAAAKEAKKNNKKIKRMYCLCGSRRKNCTVLTYDASGPHALVFASDPQFDSVLASQLL